MPPLPVDRTVKALRARVTLWRGGGLRVALVPTMGALHEGHLALVREARKHAARVLVSIFVNPTQFAPSEDFSAYPRDEAADLARLAQVGVDGVFAPPVEEMYPEGFATTVSVAGPGADLEAISRPHFFSGVATVVARLLHVCMPDVAIFGEKDYQQLLVIRQMVADLAFPVEIVGCPIVREADGLALSSRNVYLSPAERAKAPWLHKALATAAESIKAGVPVQKAISAAQTSLAATGFLVDYVKLRNALTLGRVGDREKAPTRLLAAAWLGKTRLIDNEAVQPPPGLTSA